MLDNIGEQKIAILKFNMSIISWNWSIAYNNMIGTMSSNWYKFLT